MFAEERAVFLRVNARRLVDSARENPLESADLPEAQFFKAGDRVGKVGPRWGIGGGVAECGWAGHDDTLSTGTRSKRTDP